MKKSNLKLINAILLTGLILALIKIFDLSGGGIFPQLFSPSALTVGPQCTIKTSGGQPEPYCGDLATLAGVNIREAQLQLITDDLEFPWAFEFIDEQNILLTEFKGKIKIVGILNGSMVEIEGLPNIVSGENQLGLLDVALDPGFETNNLVYFSYTTKKDTEQDLYALAVVRAELVQNRLQNLDEIFVALPFWHSTANFGGALLFDSQGYLLIATGDRGAKNSAQNPKKLHGKIIRIDSAGRIPSSNPFYEDSTYNPAIYALGVRNPQGLAMDPADGRIYETEHGPMGGDEVNIVEAGENYGWPIISYGMDYDYREIGLGKQSVGFKQPIFYYLPSIATSPLAVYRGEMFSEWDGDLLVGALRGQAVSKLDVLDGHVLSESKIIGEAGARVRDIKVASDGSIYVALEEGKLFRLFREQKDSTGIDVVDNRSGEEVYKFICSSCHSITSPGIPKLRSKSDWKERVAKGKEQLYINAIQGLNGMPERGYCADCSDEEVKAAVDYMLSTVR